MLGSSLNSSFLHNYNYNNNNNHSNPQHQHQHQNQSSQKVVSKLRTKSSNLSNLTRYRASTTTGTTTSAADGNPNHSSTSLTPSGASTVDRPSHSRSKSSGSPANQQTSGSTSNKTSINPTAAPESACATRARSPSASSIPATLYAVTRHTFRAERIDELSVEAGEAVLIVAQSTAEWFVAKPIGKLGQPGLIPVPFVEIRDMVTNQPVLDPRAAVLAARIPSVQDWQRSRREYTDNAVSVNNGSGHGHCQRASAPTALSSGPTTSRSQQADFIRAVDRGSNDSSAYEQGVKDAVRKMSRQSLKSHESGNSSEGTRDGSKTSSLSSPSSIPVSGHLKRYVHDKKARSYRYQLLVKMRDGRCWLLSRTYEDFYDLHTRLLMVEAELESELVLEMQHSLIPPLFAPIKIDNDERARSRGQILHGFVKRLFALPAVMLKHHITQEFFIPGKYDSFLNEPLTSARSHAPKSSSENQHHTQHARPSGGILATHQSPPPYPAPSTPLPPLPATALPSPSTTTAAAAPKYKNSNSPPSSRQLRHRRSNNTGSSESTDLEPFAPPRASYQTHERQESGDTVFSTDSAATQGTAATALSSTEPASGSEKCSPPTSLDARATGMKAGTAGTRFVPPATVTASTITSQPGTLKIKIHYREEWLALRLPGDISVASFLDKVRERLGLEASSLAGISDATGPAGENVVIEILTERRLDGAGAVAAAAAALMSSVGIREDEDNEDYEEAEKRESVFAGAGVGAGAGEIERCVVPVKSQSQEEFDEAKERENGKITVFVREVERTEDVEQAS